MFRQPQGTYTSLTRPSWPTPQEQVCEVSRGQGKSHNASFPVNLISKKKAPFGIILFFFFPADLFWFLAIIFQELATQKPEIRIYFSEICSRLVFYIRVSGYGLSGVFFSVYLKKKNKKKPPFLRGGQCTHVGRPPSCPHTGTPQGPHALTPRTRKFSPSTRRCRPKGRTEAAITAPSSSPREAHPLPCSYRRSQELMWGSPRLEPTGDVATS